MALPKGVSDLEVVIPLTTRVDDATEKYMGVRLGLVWEKLMVEEGLDAILDVVVAS